MEVSSVGSSSLSELFSHQKEEEDKESSERAFFLLAWLLYLFKKQMGKKEGNMDILNHDINEEEEASSWRNFLRSSRKEVLELKVCKLDIMSIWLIRRPKYTLPMQARVFGSKIKNNKRQRTTDAAKGKKRKNAERGNAGGIMS